MNQKHDHRSDGQQQNITGKISQIDNRDSPRRITTSSNQGNLFRENSLNSDHSGDEGYDIQKIKTMKHVLVEDY